MIPTLTEFDPGHAWRVQSSRFRQSTRQCQSNRLVLTGSNLPNISSSEFQGTSGLFMNSYLESKIPSFFVANLVNSQLLPAIRALNLNILNLNLPRP